MKLSSLLQDQLLHFWGNESGAIAWKVVVLTSSLPPALNSVLHKSLLEAADKCISVEFVLFEARSNHLCNIQENNNAFVQSISDLDNCSMRTCLSESRVLDGMAKMWLRDLKDETEEQMRAYFIFKNNLVGSFNQILCNLSIYVSPIIDGFSACKTCRCHGIVIDDKKAATQMGEVCCTITGHVLPNINVIENALKVGEKTTLVLPDSSKFANHKEVSAPINFSVIERTNLGSLNEGVMVGTPCVVTPAASPEIEEASDEMNEVDLNAQLFQGVCRVLHSLDEGLVCSSNYNMEAMRSALFPCYYILQPSDNRLMLLRRISGLEEILPVPEMNKYFSGTVTKEIESSIQKSILMIDSVAYDPFQHVRGFHRNLNLLVEESISFRWAPVPRDKAPDSGPDATDANSVQPTDARFVDLTEGGEALEDEWEQLVVTEIPSISAALSHISTSIAEEPKGGKEAAVPNDNTLRILERLEAPNRFLRNDIDVVATTNKLIRPNFQRLKRKQK
ncbi:hypothetical protein SAY86_024593 [Trapa natans]|uniref:Uncharacterized protein n=1 Tax=Trapa natans TaxID=22666 RepID=A0AAN7LZI0_TRANT|nr:hypothetical protein SAY86_024593 [Trapa natans]